MTESIVPSIVKSYKGRAIRLRETDRYVCLTDMAVASGKLFADWQRLKSTEAYLLALSPVMGIPITELIEVVQGGNPEKQGTWAHPKVAIKFASWCSPQFEVQVTIWIDELLTAGSVSIAPTTPQRQLAPQRDLIDYIEAAKSVGIDDSPILKALFAQRMQQGVPRCTARVLPMRVSGGRNCE